MDIIKSIRLPVGSKTSSPLKLQMLSHSWLYRFLATLSLLLAICGLSQGTELTFELPDNARQCFQEVIEAGTPVTVEFQVVTGGHYDVDVVIVDPMRKELYKDVKKQYDSFHWNASITGEYSACFSNEFSTFSHKLVYVDFQVGEESPLKGTGFETHLTAMTMMESAAQHIHEEMKSVVEYQTHHRLREAQGRKRAEDLNERVMIWSAFVTVAIAIASFGQVIILKSWFSEKKPSQLYSYN